MPFLNSIAIELDILVNSLDYSHYNCNWISIHNHLILGNYIILQFIPCTYITNQIKIHLSLLIMAYFQIQIINLQSSQIIHLYSTLFNISAANLQEHSDAVYREISDSKTTAWWSFIFFICTEWLASTSGKSSSQIQIQDSALSLWLSRYRFSMNSSGRSSSQKRRSLDLLISFV